jgi:hypothetical protein
MATARWALNSFLERSLVECRNPVKKERQFLHLAQAV